MRVMHLDAQLVGQRVGELRRLAGLQVREHQRDRLRVLAQDELRELLRVGALEVGERRPSTRTT